MFISPSPPLFLCIVVNKNEEKPHLSVKKGGCALNTITTQPTRLKKIHNQIGPRLLHLAVYH